MSVLSALLSRLRAPAPFRLDALGVSWSDSDHLYIRFDEDVSSERFAEFAEALISRTGGEITGRLRDDEADRVWTAVIDGVELYIVLKEALQMAFLMSESAEGDKAIAPIFERLMANALHR